MASGAVAVARGARAGTVGVGGEGTLPRAGASPDATPREPGVGVRGVEMDEVRRELDGRTA